MRARHQDGWLEETQAGTWRGHWVEYIRDPETGKEHRRHRSRVLGDLNKMRKYQAKAKLSEIVSPLNATQSSHRDNRVPLSWFVEHRWRPNVEGNWGASTKKTNEHFVRHILAGFGDKPLCELDSVELQRWLNHLAETYSRSMVWHCHTCLKSICAEAVDQDYLTKDPARKLKRPRTDKPDETVLEWSQYQAVIDAAETLRDKLAIKVGSGTAVRPGELFAFRWRSLEQLPSGRWALKITETIYKGKLRPWAKTDASEGYAAVPQRLARELAQWRTLSAKPGDLDFIFPNSKGGYLDYENFSFRVLKPIAEKIGLEKLNFQILRRSYATRAMGERTGTIKDVQTQLRHSRPDTTLENYVKEIPESVYAMTDAMYEKMVGPLEAKTQDLVAAPVTGGVQ